MSGIILGEVVDGRLRTPEIRREVELDAFIVMPNHSHGIVVIHWRGARLRHLRPSASDQDLGRIAPTNQRATRKMLGLFAAGGVFRDHLHL